jgi:hypothetical protein
MTWLAASLSIPSVCIGPSVHGPSLEKLDGALREHVRDLESLTCCFLKNYFLTLVVADARRWLFGIPKYLSDG